MWKRTLTVEKLDKRIASAHFHRAKTCQPVEMWKTFVQRLILLQYLNDPVYFPVEKIHFIFLLIISN